MIGYHRHLSGLYQANLEEAGELRKGICFFFFFSTSGTYVEFFFLKVFLGYITNGKADKGRDRPSRLTSSSPILRSLPCPFSRPSARHDGQARALPYHYVFAAPCPCSQSEGEVTAVARGRAHVPGRHGGGG